MYCTERDWPGPTVMDSVEKVIEYRPSALGVAVVTATTENIIRKEKNNEAVCCSSQRSVLTHNSIRVYIYMMMI